MTPEPSTIRRHTGAGRQAFARAGRRTNVVLLWILIGAFLSGWVEFAAARPVPAMLATAAHAVFGLGVVALVPWKNVIIRRAPRIGVASLTLLVIIVTCLAAGIVQLFAGYSSVLGISPIQVHVGAAIVGIPFLAWHVFRHRSQRLRPADLSRRAVLRVSAVAAVVVAGYAVLAAAARFTGPAARRPVATGSRAVDPNAIPATIWLLDRVPSIERDAHRVEVAGVRHSVAELTARASEVTARVDCTSGWFAEATWTAVRLSDLISADLLARTVSLLVTSTTGYRRRFPAAQAPELWLAVACQGRPLTAATGAPVRLVAPGHRGFWWVKWVGSVELSPIPAWQQLPFPAQ